MTESDVVVLHWPTQADEAGLLARRGTPRLLLVEPDADPPVSVDDLEEWIRLPADERDVAARILRLTKRIAASPEQPRVDATGRLFFRDVWVALSPTEARLASALAERFETVVTEDDLGRRGWPDDRWRKNVLRVHVTRLRRRLEPMGLEVRSVRSQGFIMQPEAGSPVGPRVRPGGKAQAEAPTTRPRSPAVKPRLG
jgi:DNA-binding winged helix-turn-helix (wHTH) protein